MSRLRINKDLEQSVSQGSIIKTDTSYEATYMAPGTPGQVLTSTGTDVTFQDANFWKLVGDAGTNPTTNFIGTTDAQDLVIKTNNQPAVKIGDYLSGCIAGQKAVLINPTSVTDFAEVTLHNKGGNRANGVYNIGPGGSIGCGTTPAEGVYHIIDDPLTSSINLPGYFPLGHDFYVINIHDIIFPINGGTYTNGFPVTSIGPYKIQHYLCVSGMNVPATDYLLINEY